MSCVAEDRSVFHRIEMTSDENIFYTCSSDEDIADLRCFIHRHDLHTFQSCLECCSCLYFRNNDISAHALSSGCNAFAAMAVTGNDDILACKKNRCCADN